MKYTEQILKLRSEGQSYKNICKILGCSIATVSYHCGNGQKEKTKLRNEKRGWKKLFNKKICNLFTKYENSKNIIRVKKTLEEKIRTKLCMFCQNRHKKTYININKMTSKQVLNKIGKNPKCYLTGTPIDLTKTNSYSFDHIIPKSRGGENSLENLGLCTREINAAKSDKTPDEFIELCKKVLEYNGYNITKK